MSIVIVGAYGFSNIGDEGMLDIVLKCLNEIYPDDEKIVSCVNQHEVSLLHDVATVSGISPVSIIKNLLKLRFGEFRKQWNAARTMKALVYGGGSLFTDSKGLKNISAILSTVFMARLLKKPVVLWGVSVGPLYSSTGKAIIKKILQLSTVIIVRDKKSQENVAKLSSDIEVKLGVDLLFNTVNRNKTLPLETKSSDDFLRIGISLRPYPAVSNLNYRALDESIVLAMAEALTSIEKSRKIKFYGLVFSEGNDRHDDVGMLRELKKKMESSTFGENVGGFSNRKGETLNQIISNMLKEISLMDIVVGERFHSLVTAALTGVPFVAISYDQKITEIAKATGMMRYCLDVQDSTSVESFSIALQSKIQMLIDNHDSVKQELIDKVESIKRIADEDRDYLRSKLAV